MEFKLVRDILRKSIEKADTSKDIFKNMMEVSYQKGIGHKKKKIDNTLEEIKEMISKVSNDEVAIDSGMLFAIALIKNRLREK